MSLGILFVRIPTITGTVTRNGRDEVGKLKTVVGGNASNGYDRKEFLWHSICRSYVSRSARVVVV